MWAVRNQGKRMPASCERKGQVDERNCPDMCEGFLSCLEVGCSLTSLSELSASGGRTLQCRTRAGSG